MNLILLMKNRQNLVSDEKDYKLDIVEYSEEDNEWSNLIYLDLILKEY